MFTSGRLLHPPLRRFVNELSANYADVKLIINQDLILNIGRSKRLKWNKSQFIMT